MARNSDVRFTPNVQVGIIVVVTVLLYLFFGLSGQEILQHTSYYLLMFLGAILGSYIIFGNNIGEKLHFTTKNLPLENVVLYGVLLGLMLATLETFSAGNTIFIQQSTGATESVVGDVSGNFANLISGIVFVSLFSFITANAEEILTRGFFNSIAEEYGDSPTTIKISKFILIPLIFSLLHFFMWSSTGLLALGGFVVVFLLMYHYVFGVVCQFAMDVTGSIYTPIAIHTVYNTVKMLIALGILAVGI